MFLNPVRLDLGAGRYWTGGLTVYPHAEAQAHARADLRAGVAAVGWVAGGDAGQGTASAPDPYLVRERKKATIGPQSSQLTAAEAAVAASGSDDGSLDLWRFSTDSATPELQHLEGKVAHNHVVRANGEFCRPTAGCFLRNDRSKH